MKTLNFVTLYAVDVLLAIAVAYFADQGQGWLVFGGTLAVLWLIPVAFAAWHLVRFWIAYHLYIRQNMVRYFLAEFHRAAFPDPSPYFEWDAYASHVMEDATSSEMARMKAAFILGEQASFRSTAPLTMGMAMALALVKAMDEYKPSPSTYYPQSKN